MPERRIPWRRVAHELGGTFEATTFATQTRFILQALVDGQHVEVRGRSSPYGTSGNFTEIRVEERELAGLSVDVFRDRERTSLWRNLLWRDVEVGDLRFDSDWFLRAKRDADAQLVLDKEARRLIQAVPPAQPRVRGDSGIPPLFFERGYATTRRPIYMPVFYEFSVAKGEASAISANLESSTERMHAAILAVVGLSKMRERFIDRWTQLAKDFDGRLETTDGWRIDKGTRVVFAHQGMQVSVSLSVQKGRLYTRVSCPCTPGHRPLRQPITPNRQRAEHDLGKQLESALEAAHPTRVFQDGDTICAELSGNIADVPRLLAAASVVASLGRSRGKDGPYR